jgi:hypothetical protein
MRTRQWVRALGLTLLLAAAAGAQDRVVVVPLDAPYLDNARAGTRFLIQQLERLIDATSDHRELRALQLRADRTLRRAMAFEDALRVGVTRERLYRDFNDLDDRLHEVLQDVTAATTNYPGLSRHAFGISQADRQLHWMLSQGDTTPTRSRDVLARQAEALADESKDLYRAARGIIAGDRQFEPVLTSVERFDRAADHFRDVAKRDGSLDHLRKDYDDVIQTWNAMVRAINALPAEDHAYLRNRAVRLEGLFDRIAKLLSIEGERGRIILRFGPVEVRNR